MAFEDGRLEALAQGNLIVRLAKGDRINGDLR
jgi:hypothetical protein